jgi:NAD(P)H-binding
MGPADNLMGAGPRLLIRFFRTVVAPNLGRVGKDLRAMEEELATSGLDWYALRPVKLTDGPLTRNVQASDRFTMKTISRADTAWHLLNLAEDPAPRRVTHPGHHYRRRPENARGRERGSRPLRPAGPLGNHRETAGAEPGNNAIFLRDAADDTEAPQDTACPSRTRSTPLPKIRTATRS